MKKISLLWADRIINNDKKYSDVPAQLKDEVAQALTDKGHPELVEATK